MKRPVFVFLFVLMSIAGPSHADDAMDRAETRILVTFADPGLSNAARPGPVRPAYSRRSTSYLVSVNVKRNAKRIARDFELSVVDEWPIVPLKVHCLVYAVKSDVSVEELLYRLRERPEVESAQLMNEFEVSGTLTSDRDDPYSNLQHNLETLELTQAHSWSRGDGIDITIIDTGADLDHPDLRGQIRSHHDFVDARHGDFSADAHGTAVAGVIGASSDNGVGIVGVAPSARVTVLKACWYTGSGPTAVCNSFTLAKALTHALESGTRIINLSLGGPADALLSRLLSLAIERGIVIVAAARAPGESGFPVDVPGVIVVGSENRMAPDQSVTNAPVIAPGTEILVPVPGGGFDYASGTSLSAAHVSGIVALLVAKQPRLSRDDVASLLAGSRAAVGRTVNACRALAQLLRESGCRDDSTAVQAL